MTPYVIIATFNQPFKNGVNTLVTDHTIKTTMEDCLSWVDHFTACNDCDKAEKLATSSDGLLTVYYAAKGDDWFEFQIYREDDIEL